MNFITGIAFGTAEEQYFFSLMTGELTHMSLKKLCRGAHADGLILMQIALQDWRVELLWENNYPMLIRLASAIDTSPV
jgi:DNA-binding LacI/PurR family transcriptional regulator